MRPTDSAADNQWLFPISALLATPTTAVLEKELYDRARGVEFLFRLGSSLGLPTAAMFTAATWFHRFYMRRAMEDYHRQDVAASCIFLATKTEECGRKLRDVARVCQAKIAAVDITHIPADSKEVELYQTVILLTEEVLLEALCFDFVIDSPHAELADLFEAHQDIHLVQDYAWSIAHDSYRTPLCILYPPQITAAASYVLAQRLVDGENSPSLEARISSPAPSDSLPTPPSHKPATPNASRFAIDHFNFNPTELKQVADALSILLEFYCAQDHEMFPYVSPLSSIPPPPAASRPRFYLPFSQVLQLTSRDPGNTSATVAFDRTPSSSHGGNTPTKKGPVNGGGHGSNKEPAERLDLS